MEVNFEGPEIQNEIYQRVQVREYMKKTESFV